MEIDKNDYNNRKTKINKYNQRVIKREKYKLKKKQKKTNTP